MMKIDLDVKVELTKFKSQHRHSSLSDSVWFLLKFYSKYRKLIKKGDVL